jgi:hypothetical protein
MNFVHAEMQGPLSAWDLQWTMKVKYLEGATKRHASKVKIVSIGSRIVNIFPSIHFHLVADTSPYLTFLLPHTTNFGTWMTFIVHLMKTMCCVCIYFFLLKIKAKHITYKQQQKAFSLLMFQIQTNISKTIISSVFERLEEFCCFCTA